MILAWVRKMLQEFLKAAPHQYGEATLSLLSPPWGHLKDTARPDLNLPTADSVKQFTMIAHLSAWDVGNSSKSEKLYFQEAQGRRPWLCHTPGTGVFYQCKFFPSIRK